MPIYEWEFEILSDITDIEIMRSSLSPVIDRQGGFFFYFYSYDKNERPHVHVGDGKKQRGDDGKIWLDTLAVERRGRFNEHRIKQALRIVRDNVDIYLQAPRGFPNDYGS